MLFLFLFYFFFQAAAGIRDYDVTGVQTCALPIFIADSYDAEIVRMAPLNSLAPARRKKLTLRIARHSARRLHSFRDPGVARLVDESGSSNR